MSDIEIPLNKISNFVDFDEKNKEKFYRDKLILMKVNNVEFWNLADNSNTIESNSVFNDFENSNRNEFLNFFYNQNTFFLPSSIEIKKLKRFLNSEEIFVITNNTMLEKINENLTLKEIYNQSSDNSLFLKLFFGILLFFCIF